MLSVSPSDATPCNVTSEWLQEKARQAYESQVAEAERLKTEMKAQRDKDLKAALSKGQELKGSVKAMQVGLCAYSTRAQEMPQPNHDGCSCPCPCPCPWHAHVHV